MSFIRSDIIMAGMVGLGTYGVYFLFIRPFLHPLRKIPGMPFKPIVGNINELLAGEAMESSLNMIEKYGTIVRYYFFFGMERLLVADPAIIKQILVTNCKNYVKPRKRIKLFRLIIGDGLVLLEGKDHAVHKRLMSPSFNHSAIQSMVPAFHDTACKLAENWKNDIKENDGVINIQTDLARTTLDVIGRTAFGYDFNSLHNPNEPVNKAFQTVLEGAGLSWRMALPFYHLLPIAESRRLRDSIKLMHGKVMEIIQHKRKQIQNGHDVCADILGIMMMARDEATGQTLSDLELRHEVMTLMAAGHETTATAMSWLLLALSQHPEIQNKVREEVIQFPQQYDKMNYLTKVIKETLRMYPPVQLTLRETVNDDVFREYHIPAKTICLLAIGPMMRQEENFKDANTFNPDRFDDTDTNSLMYTYLPFLIGPRMCLGYKFAMLEMKAILSVLLQNFEFEMIPGKTFKRKTQLVMRPQPLLQLKVKMCTNIY